MSLDLDTRQRAMLAEMHVPVWWPEATAVVPAPVPAPAAAAAVATPVRSAPKSLAQAMDDAPELIAASAGASSAGGLKSLEKRAEANAGGIAAMDWSTLRATVAGCTACPLCQSRKNTVFGVGPQPLAPDQPPRADWLVIGEAPGEKEDLAGEPFVGPAGQLLDNMLRAIGVSRQGVDGTPQRAAGIINVLKCRPPGNRNPEPQEIAQCEPYLRRQVELLQPKIILAMGRFAVQSLLADTVPDVQRLPLGKLRGTVYQYHGVPVVVSYHPAYLLRSPAEKAKSWADLCLALGVYRQQAG